MISFGSGRTFVPHRSFLQDYSKKGWSSAFLPLSESCQHLKKIEIMQGIASLAVF